MTAGLLSRDNHRVAYLVEFPVDGGGSLLVQAGEDDLPGGLQLAALSPGEIAARARESLEHVFEQVKPAIGAVADALRAMAPDEFTVEFGIALSAESGVVIAKGGVDVHFTVTMSWKRPNQPEADEKKSVTASGDPPG